MNLRGVSVVWALARLGSVGVVFWGVVPRAEAQATGEVAVVAFR